MSRRHWTLIGLLLCSCASPTPLRPLDRPELPAPPNDAAEPPAIEPPAAGWYPVDRVTVARLAAGRSIDILEGEALREAAQVSARQEERKLLPSLQPSLRFFRHEGLTQATEGDFVDVDKQNLFAGIDAKWSLDVVEDRVRVLAARQRRDAARFASETARRGAVLAAAEAFDRLVTSQNELAIADETLTSAHALAEFERARESGGTVLKTDRLLAESHEAEIEGRVLQVRARFRSDAARLATALRIDPRTVLYASSSDVAILDLVPDDISVNELVRRGLATRPELAEALLLREAAEMEEHGSAIAPFFPELQLGAGLGGFGENFGDLHNRERYEVALAWDLSLERFGREDEARVRTKVARLVEIRRRQGIVEAIVRYRENAIASRGVVAGFRKRVQAMREVARLVGERHRAGAALVYETIETQRELALSQRDLVRAILTQNQAERRLYYAIGADGDPTTTDREAL